MEDSFMKKFLFATITMGGLVFSLASLTHAADPTPSPTPAYEVGRETRSWLELQRSGRAAGLSHPLSAEAADLGYKRYLQSFTHPIPEFYREPSEGFSVDGGSGGGGR